MAARVLGRSSALDCRVATADSNSDRLTVGHRFAGCRAPIEQPAVVDSSLSGYRFGLRRVPALLYIGNAAFRFALARVPFGRRSKCRESRIARRCEETPSGEAVDAGALLVFL